MPTTAEQKHTTPGGFVGRLHVSRARVEQTILGLLRYHRKG